jgi:hypothetical protein
MADIIKSLGFFLFNTDVAVFQRKIKSGKHATKTFDIHLSLSAYNASAMVAVKVTFPPKEIGNFKILVC